MLYSQSSMSGKISFKTENEIKTFSVIQKVERNQ